MPFSISQKHKNKFNPFRTTAPFLAMRSKRAKETPDSIYKFIRKTKPTVTVSRPFWRDSCFSQTQMLEFLFFHSQLKKNFLLYFIYSTKILAFLLFVLTGEVSSALRRVYFISLFKNFFRAFFRKIPTSWRTRKHWFSIAI